MSQKMKCKVCGYIYNSAKGEPRENIKVCTEWEDVPDSFVCPSCGAAKRLFVPI